MTNFDTLINILFTTLITLLSAFLGFKASGIGDKNETARIMFENVYFPMFNLIENDLFREISFKNTVEYGIKIAAIVNEHPMYVNPSLRLHALRLEYSTQDNYKDNFSDFCISLNKHYDKTSKRIGLPLRSYSYRIDTSQYRNKYMLFFYVFLFKIPDFIFILIMFLLYLANKMS